MDSSSVCSFIVSYITTSVTFIMHHVNSKLVVWLLCGVVGGGGGGPPVVVGCEVGEGDLSVVLSGVLCIMQQGL